MSLLYTIVPIDEIFKQNTDASNCTNSCLEIVHGGSKVLAYKTPDNGLVIERLLSTNLKDYLDPKLQPGNVIS